MKLTLPRNVSNLNDTEQLGRYVQVAFDDIQTVVNGNIEFNQNIGAKQLACVFTSANSDAAFSHGLGRIPTGFFIVGIDTASIIYNGAATNTVDLIYLRSNVANVNAKVMVY